MKRRRFEQPQSFEDRLAAFAQDARKEAEKPPPGIGATPCGAKPVRPIKPLTRTIGPIPPNCRNPSKVHHGALLLRYAQRQACSR